MRFLTLIDRAWLVQPEGRAAEKVTQSRGDDEVSRFDRLPAAREAHYTGINKKKPRRYELRFWTRWRGWSTASERLRVPSYFVLRCNIGGFSSHPSLPLPLSSIIWYWREDRNMTVLKELWSPTSNTGPHHNCFLSMIFMSMIIILIK